MKGKYKPLAHWVKKQRDELAAYETNIHYSEPSPSTAQNEEEAEKEAEQGPLASPSSSSSSLRMTEERRSALLELGVTAAVMDRKERWTEIERERWQKKLELLRQYKEEYGNCKYIYTFLEIYIYIYIYIYILSPMSVMFAMWHTCLTQCEICIYYYFSGNVPTWSSHGKLQGKYKPLAHWVRQQRSDLAKYDKDPSQENLRMTAERKDRLLDLGFGDRAEEKSQWTEVDKERWPSRFELLKQYKEEHGDCKYTTIITFGAV
jgi:hypothetical protein